MRVACALLVALATAAACSSPATQGSPTPVRTTRGSVQIMTPTPTSAGAQTPKVESGSATVEIGDQFFLPSQVIVTVGTTVIWTNRGQVGHTATARDSSFTSGTLGFGDSYRFTFARPGRYQYYCLAHSDMFAEIVVQAP